MLISSERLELLDMSLKLDDWLRAPLYLSDGTRYFAGLESKAHSSGNIELVISCFDSQLWDDLWRVEIDTSDKPGNSLLLYSLLRERGFQILSSESSINTFASNHSTTVIVSAKEYSGDLDLTQRERLVHSRPELDEMRREILVYFGDQIALNPDRTPALKLRHLRSYRKLSEDLRNGSRFLLNRAGQFIKNGKAQLTPRALDHIRTIAGPGRLFYSAAVDTKDRMIRIIFFGASHPRSVYAQIIFDSEDGDLLKALFAKIYGVGGNIVRSTIRPTPSSVAVREIEKLSGANLFFDQTDYVTVDLTINFLDSNSDESFSERVNSLDGAISGLAKERVPSLVVTRRSWAQ